MENLNRVVDHSNGLGDTFNKALAVQTLQTLVNGGHTFDATTGTHGP
jgi:hypothetical protein